MKQQKREGLFFNLAEEYLNAKYQFRFNTIKKIYEYSGIGDLEFVELNEHSLFVELNKANIKIGQNYLKSLLRANFCQNYNPIEFYFDTLHDWSEEDPDYITKLGSFVKTQYREEFDNQLKKWLVRAVRCALEDGYYNKHALILVHSKQNSGKSSFCRYLCPPPLKDYIVENVDVTSKDSLIALASNFIINLDELKQFNIKDVNVIKTWISQDRVNIRLPYESRASSSPRVCSFVGSTNEGEFLKDYTGSVRLVMFQNR